MFVKNSLALQDTVNCILTIFKMLIVNSGGLDKAEKLEQWRNAVRDIQWELLIRVLLLQESVRSIANRTDNILHMLIGMDKYVHWMENIGMPGIPFPDWHQALFPPIESIADHPWLLTVEWQYNVGLQVQPLAPTTEACLTWLPRGQQAIYQCEALHWVKVKPEPPQKERWPWQKRLQYLNASVMIMNDPKGQERSYDPTSQSPILSDMHQLQDTPVNYAIPPPLQHDSSAYVPLPTPPIPPTHQ
ncbi:hypothetical protein EDD16DRAFT_1528331 [Pisolithus croceorrhizus]|nr:hypothetical protein EDD16DRAFT_1528331 [Pisolithus croceorrhizus]